MNSDKINYLIDMIKVALYLFNSIDYQIEKMYKFG